MSRSVGGPVNVRSCAIGVDFGTESGRVLVLDLGSGEELGGSVVEYASGVIDRELPSTGEPLPGDWALQDPGDWVSVIEVGVPDALAGAGVDPAAVVGLGVDFTSCTVLPTTAQGTPLSSLEQWRGHPHAWPKLWKHHAAQHVADRLTDVALARREPFLQRYGGRISSEWYFPKLIELWLQDRDLYDAASAFVEATDWIVWWMTGELTRQTCTAAYKAMWSADDGLPPVDYFEAAYPGFDRPEDKLGNAFAPLGTSAGTIRPDLAGRLGLSPSVTVAVGNVDSFVSVAGAGVQRPGIYVMVVGTSICDMLVHPDEILLDGITGVARDGILPGLYGYEAGQAAVGDMLAWYVDTLRPGAGTFEELEAEAATLAPGETGLLALDWFNGNRTILADADLTGAIVGLTLQSTPVEVYRALLESIAFGNRRIIENFEEHGLAVERIVACGGIAHKSPLLMQLLADTSSRPLDVPRSAEIPARGAALFGAVAAGAFADIAEAVAATSPPSAATYTPEPAATEIHDRVYAVYRELYQLLGRDRSDLLHRLKRLRAQPAPSPAPARSFR